jgi:hypothetical protein
MRLLSVVFYGSDHDARARRRGRAQRHGSGGAGGIDPANLRDSRDDGPREATIPENTTRTPTSEQSAENMQAGTECSGAVVVGTVGPTDEDLVRIS